MNILMIGHSRAGKTTFMAGMYKFLGDSTDGYGIKVTNNEAKKQLKRLADGLSKGVYPVGTDVQSQYNFWLTVNGDSLIPFNWIDYRGGALMCEDEDDDEVIDLMKNIGNADALIVFLDGQKLQNHKEKYEMEYNVIISCIESALTRNRGSVFPISFIISKFDLLDNKPFEGLDYFEDLFEEISLSSNVEGILTSSFINKESYYTPFVPLIYSLWRGAPLYINKREKARDNALKSRDKYEPTSFLDALYQLGNKAVSYVAEEVFDSGWDTEIDKYNRANGIYEDEERKLKELDVRQNEMQEKINGFIKDKIIFEKF